MAEPLGIGIIGAGKAGQGYARTIQGSGTARVVGLCAAHEDSARGAARRLQVPFWTADHRRLVEHPEVEAVIVASPDRFHREHAEAAARAGRHVLCEKPMCRSLEEADSMIQACREAGVCLMVGFTERYTHPCRDAHRRIQEGQIGRPRMILARRCHPRSVVRGRRWLNDRETGGVLSYAGTHNIDLICWFMGEAPERVYAEMGPLILPEREFTDCAVMTFRFPSGGIATLFETFAYPARYPYSVDRSIEILGQTGLLKVDFMSQPLQVYTAEDHQLGDAVTWPLEEGRITGALLAEVQHFVRCVRERLDPQTGGPEGRLAILIAEAAREASRSGRAVRVAGQEPPGDGQS